MTPEEYRTLLLKVIAREDVRTLLGLVYYLREYSSEEALVRNFSAMHGDGECRTVLRALRRWRILGRGPFDEYVPRQGYESVFDEVVPDFIPDSTPISEYLTEAIKSGDEAAIKMIELLLKLTIHGIAGYTQYRLLEEEISEQFSPSVFHALEQRFIADKLCVYGERRGQEFLSLYNQSTEELGRAREILKDKRRKELFQMPVVKMVDDAIRLLAGLSKREPKEWKEIAATWAKMPESDIEKLSGYFSGFRMDVDFLFITGDMLIDRDSLYFVITDRLTRYDIREWRTDPVVFIVSELPVWVEKPALKLVFNDAYPKFSDRKIAIAAPGGIAYANFKQELLTRFLTQLGINEIREWSL